MRLLCFLARFSECEEWVVRHAVHVNPVASALRAVLRAVVIVERVGRARPRLPVHGGARNYPCNQAWLEKPTEFQISDGGGVSGWIDACLRCCFIDRCFGARISNA